MGAVATPGDEDKYKGLGLRAQYTLQAKRLWLTSSKRQPREGGGCSLCGLEGGTTVYIGHGLSLHVAYEGRTKLGGTSF